MNYEGHVENGVVVFDEPVSLKDGTRVSIAVALERTDTSSVEGQSLYEHYKPFIGIIDDMPEDWSENHDKYLEEDYRR